MPKASNSVPLSTRLAVSSPPVAGRVGAGSFAGVTSAGAGASPAFSSSICAWISFHFSDPSSRKSCSASNAFKSAAGVAAGAFSWNTGCRGACSIGANSESAIALICSSFLFTSGLDEGATLGAGPPTVCFSLSSLFCSSICFSFSFWFASTPSPTP
ncbi:unannotated protein [freshwater metagenome]|uniref:Unannotated protein n=1 Tax=freshwater metagenome TaxID=449393 RepID=A0A6J6EQA1_9ZZZZ